LVESTVELRLSTWDTPDGRLARNGISLSYMDGEWLLRLPDGQQRVAGVAHRVPAELRVLVTGWVRTARLRAARTERVRRTRCRLADADGVTTAQLIEDEVSTVEPGPPVPGPPAPGPPAQGLPAQGLPAQGLPAQGLPAQGPAAAPPPTPGTPAPGTPAPGTPAPGHRILTVL